MKQRCACDAYDVEANDATYVRDGHPLCHEQTCAKVKEHRGLCRVPHFDDIEHESPDLENERLGDFLEPYRPNKRYRDI